MAKEMEQAAQIQLGLLPKAAPQIKGLEIAGRTAAARVVGGDYYDFIPYADGRIGMVVADVAGKGMPASLIMTGLHARVHVLFEEPGDLGAKITRLNRQTCGNTPDNRFITFFMIEVNPSTGEMTYCNAGHNPALVVRKAGGHELLAEGGLILGILPQMVYKATPAQLSTGDLLVIYTDGVTEAVNAKDEDFGEDRLRELVESLRDRPVAEIVDAVHKSVQIHAAGMPQFDDITVVALRKLE